jgi:hypothetical protein
MDRQTYLKLPDFKFEKVVPFEKLPEEKKLQKIQIFPRGKVYIEKYDEWKECDDVFFDEIIKNFNDETLSKPKIDKDHDFGISYGDIIELEKTDTGLYASVYINDLFYDAVINRHYNYISPSFGERTGTDGVKHETALNAVSLVNYPALEGTIGDLQSQMLFVKKLLKQGDYMEFEKRLAELEGKMSVMTLDKNQGDVSLSKEILGMAQEMNSELIKANKTVTELNKSVEDGKKEIEKVNNELTTKKEELNVIKTAELKKEAETVVKQAIEDGQFHAALYDKKVNDYILDKNNVLEELKVIPKNPKKGQQSFSGGQEMSRMSDEEYKMFEELGLDPKDEKVIASYKKIKESEKQGEE